MPSAALSPSVVQDLLQLRALMDRAIHESQSAAPLARLIAVILLDGVNERALISTAGQLSLAVKENERFENIYSQVREHLGPKLQPLGWQEVRQLHRVRNLAQHVGVSADRDMLPLWAAATEKFVNALVYASFDVELTTVRLSDAVLSPDLREILKTAEQYLLEKNPAQAFEQSFLALHEAWGRWGRTHIGTTSTRRPSSLSIVYSDSFEYLEHISERLQQVLATQLFASDSGDYIWMKDVSNAGFNHATKEEAERAISIAFWWIVRWEALESAGAPNRAQEILKAARLTRDGDGPSKLHRIEEAEHFDREMRVKIKIGDVPQEQDFPLWRRLLVDLLKDRISTSARWIDIDAAGNLTLFIPLDIDVQAVIASINASLGEVERACQLEKDRDIAGKKAYEERSAQISAYSSASPLKPTWVQEIKLGELQSPGVEVLYVQVTTEAVAHVRYIAELISTKGDIRHWTTVEGIMLAHDLDASLELLSQINDDVTERIETYRATTRHQKQVAAKFKTEFEQAIAGL